MPQLCINVCILSSMIHRSSRSFSVASSSGKYLSNLIFFSLSRHQERSTFCIKGSLFCWKLSYLIEFLIDEEMNSCMYLFLALILCIQYCNIRNNKRHEALPSYSWAVHIWFVLYWLKNEFCLIRQGILSLFLSLNFLSKKYRKI